MSDQAVTTRDLRDRIRRAGFKLLQRCGRAYPFFRGASRLASLKPFVACLPANPTLAVPMRNGLDIVVFPHDFIGRTTAYFGDNDRKVSWICRRVLGPGDAVLDIGAHHGLIALEAAACVGPRGVVHAFEPQPTLAQTLRDSVERNALGNLHVHGIGLGARDGAMMLYYPPNDLSSATLEPFAGWRQVEVPVRAAGPYLAGLNLPPLRLLKIDVEGFEAVVIRSALPVLQANRPDVIVFESHHAGSAEFWRREVVQLLAAELGYEIYQIPKAMVRMRIRRLAPGIEPPHDSYDFVAVTGPGRSHILRRLRA